MFLSWTGSSWPFIQERGKRCVARMISHRYTCSTSLYRDSAFLATTSTTSLDTVSRKPRLMDASPRHSRALIISSIKGKSILYSSLILLVLIRNLPVHRPANPREIDLDQMEVFTRRPTSRYVQIDAFFASICSLQTQAFVTSSLVSLSSLHRTKPRCVERRPILIS